MIYIIYIPYIYKIMGIRSHNLPHTCYRTEKIQWYKYSFSLEPQEPEALRLSRKDKCPS